MLHLSGFPDSAAARRAARVIAAEGGPTDHFWVGALAIDEGRWTDVEAARRVLERQAQSVELGRFAAAEPTLPHTRRPWEPTRGSSEAIAAGWRNSNRRWPGFQWPAGTSNRPQKYLRYRVGKLLFDDGRQRDAERYFRSFNTYDYFYTSQAELYLGRIAEARGRPEEAVTHYGRFVRWWRHADEPLRPLREEARQALSRLAGE